MSSLGCRRPPDSQYPQFGSKDHLLWRDQADGAGEWQSRSQAHQGSVEEPSYSLLPACLICI